MTPDPWSFATRWALIGAFVGWAVTIGVRSLSFTTAAILACTLVFTGWGYGLGVVRRERRRRSS